MVFYSRYYIQEMLLVTFSLGAIVSLWRYLESSAHAAVPTTRSHARPRVAQACWLIALGLSIGMMHASKETSVISLAAMAIAGPATLRQLRRLQPGRAVWHGLVVLGVAMTVSALFFSAFLRHPRGVIDSYAALGNYLTRASGEGSAGQHVHAAAYYLQILFWWRTPRGSIWTEGAVAALAMVGLGAAVRGRGMPAAGMPLVRFVGVYTLLLVAVYSALPYKTPWCALGLLQGMLVLAGVGSVVMLRAAPGYAWKASVAGLLIAAGGHLGWQAWRASFVDYEDPHNPYVYAHTTSEVPRLADRIKHLAARHPDRTAMHIQVICPNHDYWPLPWYLRGFSRVGWYDRFPPGPPAPLVVTQPEIQPALLQYLYVRPPPGQRYLYVPVPARESQNQWHLRPHVPLCVYARWDLWESSRGQTGGYRVPSTEYWVPSPDARPRVSRGPAGKSLATACTAGDAVPASAPGVGRMSRWPPQRTRSSP